MKKIQLYIYGVGNVGSTLINQIHSSHEFFRNRHGFDLQIVALANSTKVLINNNGISQNWKEQFYKESVERTSKNFFKNLNEETINIAVDATASKELSESYHDIVQEGFHIATANKIANTFPQVQYDSLRSILLDSKKHFEYETNVGAGLPVIETLKSLVDSGEKILKVNGVFSGSLGFIFSEYSKADTQFSEILKDALSKGYTEPDPRDDLSGHDVARKLLILAREIGIKANLSDVQVESLVPEDLKNLPKEEFLNQIESLDSYFERKKQSLDPNQVLRHLGSLDVLRKTLTVELLSVPKESAIGSLEGSDGFFEIFSSSYREYPLIIKGAGAGPEVTARGLLSDIIKIGNLLTLKSRN